MLLKNWYKLMACHVIHPNSSDRVKVKDVNGTEQRVYNSLTLALYPGTSASDVKTSFNQGVVFGTGNTPPSFDDYTLSGSLFTTFSVSCVDVTDTTYDPNGITRSVTYTITNSGDEVTIREVARILQFYKTTNTYGQAMVERTLLDEPVTIPKGGIGQVTYTVRMEYPTA